MEEVISPIDNIESLLQSYGIIGAIVLILLLAVIYYVYYYLKKKIDKNIDEASEEALKEFQSTLDKKLVRYSTKHQKQIDAVQDCYKKFKELRNFVNYLVNGEKFTQPMMPEQEFGILATYRLDFVQSYSVNKILFPESLNNKIESLLPEIDNFIEDYSGGLIFNLSDDDRPEEYRNEPRIAGIWPVDQLGPTLAKMDEISIDIEAEFRKLYGTDEE